MLAQELEALDVVDVLAAAEAPAAGVADRVDDGNTDRAVEPLEQPSDQRSVRPRTGVADVEVISARDRLDLGLAKGARGTLECAFRADLGADREGLVAHRLIMPVLPAVQSGWDRRSMVPACWCGHSCVDMELGAPQIVAFGGGGFSMEAGNPLLDEYVLGLGTARAGWAAGGERPRVCFVPTASGDADHYIVRFYRAFPASVCEPSHVSLFRRDRGAGIDRDVASHLLEQDVIYVGGGSLISLLGVWRAHGLDEALVEAWARGIVLCGLSAGSLCWFSEAISAFHGTPSRVDGLGLLPYSNCVHLNDEERRATFRERIAAGELRPGYGAEDGAALHFVGTSLTEVIASRQGVRAYRVDALGETPLAARYLGAAPVALVA